MADIFEIAGRIHSTSQEHVISPADEILDTSQNKKQHLINADVARHDSEINSPTNGLNKRVADIEALGQIGDTPVETNASNIINNTSLSGKVPSASAVNGVYNAVVANAGYYTCDSEASIAAKVVEASGYVLTVGGCIKIKMTNANTADDDATLNINSTGAKALYYAGERASATNSWEEGETVEVYYDGTNFYANSVAGGSGSGDGAFDVSAKYPTSGVDGGNTYTLEGALAVLNANLSARKKKGGMSIKFIQSIDNKYVKFFCTADEFTTDTTKWQGVDDEPTAGSDNLVKSGGVYSDIVKNQGQYWYNKTDYTLASYAIRLDGTFGTLSTNKHGYVAVVAGEEYIIEAPSEAGTRIVFADSNSGSSGGIVPMVTGTSIIEIHANNAYLAKIPVGCTYLLIYNTDSSTEYIIKRRRNIDNRPSAASKNFVESGGVYNEINGNVISHTLNEVEAGKRAKAFIQANGNIRVKVSQTQGETDTDWSLYYADSASAVGNLIQSHIEFGEEVKCTIPNDKYGVCIMTVHSTSTGSPVNDIFEFLVLEQNGLSFEIEKLDDKLQTVEQNVGTLEEDIDSLSDETDSLADEIGTVDESTFSVAAGRISQLVSIGHANKKVFCCLSLTQGEDDGQWRIYGTNNGAIDTTKLLTAFTDFGKTVSFIVPEDGNIWLFTSNNGIQTLREYLFTVTEGDGSLCSQVAEMKKQVEKTENQVDTLTTDVNALSDHVKEYIDPILSSDITTSTARLNQNLSLNDYKGQPIVVSISSPIDEDTFRIYGCNDDGTLNTKIILTPKIACGNYSEPFNVPENGYIWLFTGKPEAGTEKTYNVIIGSGKYLPAGITRNEYEIQNNKNEIQNNKDEIEAIKQTKTFTGKTIVCFGDSITEFAGVDGKRYSDYLAEISGATVINVGIGGTRLQQRMDPTDSSSPYTQAYAALDIVNMVKASCEQDFTLQIAAAQYMYDHDRHPQYIDIVARLQSIDWSTVSAVTILGGTNDWTGSALENVGTHGSTDPNTTLGAINYMLQMLSYTYPKIPVYFFTPLMRYIDQDFESAFTTSKAFTTGQHVLYEQKLYTFISDHSAGDWNPNEVRRLTKEEMYNISSDVIIEDVGMNLKAFSQLIADEVKYNHIPICDMYNEMWNAFNYTDALTVDLTHPRNGDAIIAQKIFGFINANRKFN